MNNNKVIALRASRRNSLGCCLKNEILEINDYRNKKILLASVNHTVADVIFHQHAAHGFTTVLEYVVHHNVARISGPGFTVFLSRLSKEDTYSVSLRLNQCLVEQVLK